MIIGISGKIGSGKDTVGLIIQWLQLSKDFPAVWGPSYNKQACAGLGTFKNFVGGNHDWGSCWQIKKIADKLKECVVIITGMPRYALENMDIKNSLIGSDWGDITYRKLLQLLGTEVGRYINPDFWVNALFIDYKKPAQIAIERTGGYTNSSRPNLFPNWIITDIRFPNELRAVKDRGGVTIRLTRTVEVDPEIAKHRSETALDNAEFDYVIDNSGTIEELIEEVKSLNLLG
jgi:hypothetical protein